VEHIHGILASGEALHKMLKLGSQQLIHLPRECLCHLIVGLAHAMLQASQGLNLLVVGGEHCLKLVLLHGEE
jgi:hypothetical protein